MKIKKYIEPNRKYYQIGKLLIKTPHVNLKTPFLALRSLSSAITANLNERWLWRTETNNRKFLLPYICTFLGIISVYKFKNVSAVNYDQYCTIVEQTQTEFDFKWSDLHIDSFVVSDDYPVFLNYGV